MTLILEDIKKSFGDGENKTEVLKGISCEIKDGNICVLLDLPVQVNQHCLTLSVELKILTVAKSKSVMKLLVK